MQPIIINKMVTGVRKASSCAGKAARVVGWNSLLVEDCHMRRQRAGARIAFRKVLRELVDLDAAGAMREVRERAEKVRKAEQARVAAQFALVKGRSWADIMFPPLPLEDPVCRPLPAGRMTPPQFREWVGAGWARVQSYAEARRYQTYVEGIRRDYFAQLPDCVFTPAVKREDDAAELIAYRAGFKALQAQRELRAEIRVMAALLVDYQRQPQLHFRTRAEAVEAMKALGAEVKALERKLSPAAAEVTLDDTLWRGVQGGWAEVVATGRVAKPVVVEITAEAKAEAEKKAKAEREEAERIARWKKMNATAVVASASRDEWKTRKEVAKRPRTERDPDAPSTGFNYWREQNY